MVLAAWTVVVVTRDHVLGCPGAPLFIYDRGLHLATLLVYVATHGILLNQVRTINQPTEFSYSKMGNVLLLLRRMRSFLLFRTFIVSLWLFMVFFENAEETYVPVGVLGIHSVLVCVTILYIVWAVREDNQNLDERDRLYLGRIFYFAAMAESVVSILWFLFNVVDVTQCHNYYDGVK